MNLPNPASPETVPDVPHVQALNQQVRIVLHETSHPGNVGAAARAMKTMGLQHLVLVNPKDPKVLRRAETIALASGALDVLEQTQIVPDIQTALADVQWSVAMSARLREYGPQRLLPRAAAAQLHQWSLAQQRVALVFGNERYGLPNEVVEQCSYVSHIPSNPAYSSLNLAQAVQVMAWELRMQALDSISQAGAAQATALQSGTFDTVGFVGEAATQAEIAGMYQHLEEALVAVEFLDPQQPKKLMSRLRRLFGRTQLEREEINILRGIATKILKKAS